MGIGVFGREDNLAASFSDYAITRFRDLRRLLFWHGRGFSNRYYTVAQWFMVKCGQFSFILMFLNISNGFSGSSFYDDFYYSLFDFLMTNFAIGFYLSFDSDIDFRLTDNEEKLGYKLSDFYLYIREGNRHFLKTYLGYFSYSIITSAALFYVTAEAYKYSPAN